MDREKNKEGIRLMLEGIGEDVNREGLLETPDRIARMCEEIFGGLKEDASVHLQKQFQATNNNIVLERNGKARVAYIPDERVAGLSKLARTVEVFARRPQIQENMTIEIADAIWENLKPKGVQKPGTITSTMVTRGVFKEDFGLQQTFLQMVRS